MRHVADRWCPGVTALSIVKLKSAALDALIKEQGLAALHVHIRKYLASPQNTLLNSIYHQTQTRKSHKLMPPTPFQTCSAAKLTLSFARPSSSASNACSLSIACAGCVCCAATCALACASGSDVGRAHAAKASVGSAPAATGGHTAAADLPGPWGDVGLAGAALLLDLAGAGSGVAAAHGSHCAMRSFVGSLT